MGFTRENVHDTEEPQRIGLLTIDPLRTLGLETILSARPGLEVVALSAATGNLDLAGFSLLVIDADYTEHLSELLTGFRRKYQQLKVIVLGMEGDNNYIERVIGAGAKGYLTHFAKDSEVQMAIDIVLDGSVWAPRKVLANLLEAAGSSTGSGVSDQPPKITGREQQVLKLLVAGRPNREIGRVLGIDEGTVKAHVGRLMRKVGVENRIALTMMAMEKKLVSDESPNS
jgi:DNA-binding NarL/FixJ family response regulator